MGSGAQSVSSIAPNNRAPLSAFLEHLVKNKVVPEDIAVQASSWKKENNGKAQRTVLEVLQEEFGVSRDLLYNEVAQFYSFRIVSIEEQSPRRLSPSAVNKILSSLPEAIYQLAVDHKVLPYEMAVNQQDKILVVTPNPSGREIHDVARSLPYKKFEICYMKEADWDELWRQVTIDRKSGVPPSPPPAEPVLPEHDVELDHQLDQEINRSQIIAMVENLLLDAVRVGASDIHILPKGVRKTEILFRIDGGLSLWRSIDDIRSEAIVAVAKGRGENLDRFERAAAQDGSAQKIIDNQMIRFRLSVLPIVSRETNGKFESLVVRILRDADASVSLETIGFDPYSLRVFKEAISKPHGLVILTGPTGTGKSTTLVAALRSVMNSTMNTITVEDPVEYLLDGARQVRLSHKLSFDEAVRAILRHDPDIVMVGEIRDRITADIAIKLANTGHLTFSTLHTNDASSAVSRLFKMGVEPFLVAQALNIVVGQRLVRKLCVRCKEPAGHVSRQFLNRIGFTTGEAEQTQFFRAVGCSHCVAGYKGRLAIHESLYFTTDIRDLIIDGEAKIDTEAIKEAAIRHGMQTLRRSGIELIKKGITTIDEVIAKTTND